MYKINDTIIYGTEGVCRILDIAKRTYGGQTDVYYILSPIYKRASTVMLPRSNATLMSKMRRLLTPDEANKLILSIRTESVAEWIDNEKQRREHYRDLLACGDRSELVRHIKGLYERTERQKAVGKRLHACDERFLEDAQRILHDEFSVVLGIPRENVLSYIRDSVG